MSETVDRWFNEKNKKAQFTGSVLKQLAQEFQSDPSRSLDFEWEPTPEGGVRLTWFGTDRKTGEGFQYQIVLHEGGTWSS